MGFTHHTGRSTYRVIILSRNIHSTRYNASDQFTVVIMCMCLSNLYLLFQDLTITVASELPSTEVDLVEDKDEHHVVNRQSFVDEQEWHLYVHTECDKKELVLDQADNSVKRSALSVKCRAARRPGYFVWNIFMITVGKLSTFL